MARQEPEKVQLPEWWTEEKGFVYVDTGAMYRGLAVYFLDRGIGPEETERMEKACEAQM